MKSSWSGTRDVQGDGSISMSDSALEIEETLKTPRVVKKVREKGQKA